MSDDAKVAFAKVKPFCIKVSQQRNAISVQQLYDVIKPLSSDVVQELHEYLLFPLRVIFIQKANIKEDAIVSSAECMQYVLLKTQVKEWKTFEDLCQILLLQISGTNKEQLYSVGSEDKKISILNALLSLLETSLHCHYNLFYNINHIPFIGHIVSICLSIVANEKHKQLRKIAITVIKCLCFAPNDAATTDDKMTRIKIGNCIASFVPGILSGLIKVVSGDANQGQAVKCKTLETISEVLKITASDSDIDLANDPEIKNCLMLDQVPSQLQGITVDRDLKWVNNLASKMKIVLQHVMTASDSLNVNVRLACLAFAEDMLKFCSKKVFHIHVGYLLKIPCKLLHDNVVKVVVKCKKIIEDFSSQNENDSKVTDILQEELFNLCSNLPKTLSKASDNEKLSCLNLIIGILEVLKLNVKSVLYSFAHLDNLLKSLIFCLQIDFSELHKIEEVTAAPTNFDQEITAFFKGQSKHWLFRKSFVHFHNTDICETLVKLCQLLGKYGDLDMLIDNLKERYENESQSISVVLIINEIILGTLTQSPKSLSIYDHIDYLIEIYTANKNWYLCTSYDSLYDLVHRLHVDPKSFAVKPVSKNLSLKTINSNIILTCLHLEALATFAIALSDEFRKTLIKTLYPLLEKVNDSNYLIQSCALKALDIVALSCAYSNISSLINENADYLVSTISIHLRHLGLFPRSPDVLQAMLTHCDVAIFPLIRDTIDEILTTLDLHRQESHYLLSFLPVMMTTVKAINAWFAENLVNSTTNQLEDEIQGSSPQCEDEDFACSISKELSVFHSNFKIGNLDSPITELNDAVQTHQRSEVASEHKNDDFGETKEVLEHIKVVEQIVHRSTQLLASEDPKVRLIVMNIIDESVSCLSGEKNTLLPVVHKLWKPLIARCSDSELQVAAKAFNVICNLGSHSGDFIRRKFTKDLLPKLLAFLSKNSRPDAFKMSNITYSHTTLFKLQLTVLNNLGPLLLNSTVSFNELHDVCNACRNYLSSHQPSEFQTAAVCLFKCLIDLDRDALWLFLSDIFSPHSSFHSDVEGFKVVTVSGTHDNSNEFAINASSQYIGYFLCLKC